MRSAHSVDVCADIGSVEEGVLALWGVVVMQAVQDVGYGLRHGMITADLVPTAKRMQWDDSECRTALRFLLGRDLEILTANLASRGRVNLSRGFLLSLAREHGAKLPDPWKNRPRLTAEQQADRKVREKAYQQTYQRQLRAQKQSAA